MKSKDFRYLVGEGFKGAWANRLMSLASMGVLIACMVILGLALLISQNVSKAVGSLEKQNIVLVYMKDYNWALYDVVEGADESAVKDDMYVIHDEAEAQAFCDEIAELDNVDSVEYIPSDMGLDSVKKRLEDNKEAIDSLDSNPLSRAAKVTMKDMSKFRETVEKIEKMDGTSRIRNEKDLAETLDALKKGLLIAGIWIISILLLISFVVVANTIRITMYSRKLEISIMKAVGATNAFVRIPFVIEGIIIGIFSAIISMGLLYFCYRVAGETILGRLPMIELVRYGSMVWYLLGLFLIIGVLAGAIGSFVMIRKYLRREGSEFSAI